MTERRETGRKASRKTGRRSAAKTGEPMRIAKYLAHAGIGSRRACEALIEAGRVKVDGRRLVSPAFNVTGEEDIRVDGKPVTPPAPARLWRYHKPAGLLTTNVDPAGRRTIFDELPKSLPRVVTVGRLDLNTEGLLLLTTDGDLARALELPANKLPRSYRARAHGRVTPDKLEKLRDGIVVDGERFGRIDAELEIETGANNWLRVTLAEGRKREVRRALEAVGLMVNRLIRVSYGPFELGSLQPGAVEEVPAAQVSALGEEFGLRFTGVERSTQRAKSRRAPARSRVHRRKR